MAITSTSQRTAAFPTGTTIATGAKIADIKLSKVIWVEAGIESFFEANGFIGKEGSDNAIIWKKTELEKGGGETVRIFMNNRLTGSGVTTETVLVGNEEQLKYSYFELTLGILRHAVALGGALTEQRSVAAMRVDAKNRLRTWLAEKLDTSLFTALSAGTPTYAVYPGSATSVATLGATDTMDLATIGKARATAKLNRIKGINLMGKMHYVLIMHPEQAYDLQNSTNSALWTTIQQYAQVRGDKNPLFTGALGGYLGVIMYEHESVTQADTGGVGSDLHYSMALLLGSGAGCRAYGGFKDTNKQIRAVEDTFDYGDIWATAIGVIFIDGRSKFSSDDGSTYTDYARVALYTVCTDL